MALDWEGAQRFASAQTSPGTLEQILGLGVNLPLALAQAKANEQRKMSLLQMLQNPQTATPPMPSSVSEAAQMAQIKQMLTKPVPETTAEKEHAKLQFGALEQQVPEETLVPLLESAGLPKQPHTYRSLLAAISAKKAEAKPDIKPPPGYRFKPDGSLEIIPGGPAESKEETKEEKTKNLASARSEQARIVLGKIKQAKELIGFTSTGYGGLLKDIPLTKSNELKNTIETIKANLGFDELQKMRQSSPTGGALGQIAVREIELLQSTVASLDQIQSESKLRSALEEIEGHYNRWLSVVYTGGIKSPGTKQPGKEPQTAEQIKALYQSGRITKEQAKALLQKAGM